jgi:phosphoserine aminotransferase
MARQHNFGAGPAVMPEAVIDEIIAALPEFKGTGMGLMEISHRSKEFEDTLASAEGRVRAVMGVPADYTVLFLQGGATLQFYMTALNLLRAGDKADFLLTGVWSNKALKEAKYVTKDALGIWDGKSDAYTRVPRESEYAPRPDAVYLHYTSNNTIYGTQWNALPRSDGPPLVCDMSSDICSRPTDVAKHALIYAGAQKNLGPSGITVVILSPWAMDRSPGNALPAMLDYKLHAENKSLYNTTNTFAIFALDRTLAWIEGQGGLGAMEQRNEAKARALYSELDRTQFWKPLAHESSRSRMNVTWRTSSEALDRWTRPSSRSRMPRGSRG